jgi:hypothetical protein
MQLNGSMWMFVAYVIITIITLIVSILTSFMITSKGTKEYNWWVFLMVVSWVTFGCSAGVSGISGYMLFKRPMTTNQPATNTNVTVNIPSVPDQPQQQVAPAAPVPVLPA